MRSPFFEIDLLAATTRLAMPLVLAACCVLAPGAAALANAGVDRAPTDRPNFVLMFADDLGYGDLGCYGATGHQTPHIDRLAAEGVRLSDFYVSTPFCSPSRAAVLTGCYHKRVSVNRVYFPGDEFGLSPGEITLAEVLRACGYRTGCIGKWHLGDAAPMLPTRQGFDEFFGIPYSNDMWPPHVPKNLPGIERYPALPLMRGDRLVEAVVDQTTLVEQYTREAERFIRDHRDEPFFLYLPQTAVHLPLYPGKAFQGSSDNGLYGDWVQELDASVGRVLRTLEQLQLDDNTLVIFTSDNGALYIDGASNGPLRGFKGQTYEGGLREPFVARWPGQIPAGSQSAEIVAAFDLFPTLVQLAGGQPPADRMIDGRDVWPILAGAPEARSPHEAFYYYRGDALQAVRSGPWKLHLTSGELYHLGRDLGETEDVAAHEPEVVARLVELAESMRADLGDGERTGRGVRAEGRYTYHAPVIDFDGIIRPDARRAPDQVRVDVAAYAQIDDYPPFTEAERTRARQGTSAWTAQARAAAAVQSSSAPAEDRPRRPNVIVVLTDDQGFGDVGVHGNDYLQTPQLDRFATEGVEFTRFYCEPVCSPTRASVMTGRSYYRTGVIHTSRGAARMHGDEITLAEYLGPAGYRTGVFGKWHLGDNYPMRPQDQGFETSLVHRSGGIGQAPDVGESYFDPLLFRDGEPVRARGYCTDVFFDAAIDFIRADDERPFFVYLPTNAPHTPLEVADAAWQRYAALGLDETTARVYAMVENIDANFGRLLAALDEEALRQDTLVVFICDNGPQQTRFTSGLRERKSNVYEGGIRVCSFWQWPAAVAGGRQIDRTAAHIDLLPTILDAAGLPLRREPVIDGRSLLPLLTGAISADAWPHRTLFFQCHRGLNPERWHNCAAVTQRYKLVGAPDTFNRERLTAAPTLELYDLSSDPGEQHDLAAELPDVVDRLRRQYDRWFDSVRDERRFERGRITIGSPHEPTALLCRYQDGTYIGDRALGWSVDVAPAEGYELRIRDVPDDFRGQVEVRWQGEVMRFALAGPEHWIALPLVPGSGELDVLLLDDRRPEQPIVESDVFVRRR